MLGSLRERLARRQHLQRRIDMLLEGQDGDDIEAAIAEVLRREFARLRGDRIVVNGRVEE
jgi:hypothetical protein